MTKHTIFPYIFLVSLICILPVIESRTCDDDDKIKIGEMIEGKTKIMELKVVGIASILIAGALGVTIPIYGTKMSSLNPENNMFFLVKAFAGGVILATGFVHILPDAFQSLNSRRLGEKPWGDFPFAGFVAMVSAMLTMMIECFATSYYKRFHVTKGLGVVNVIANANGDEENGKHEESHVHVDVHTHASHGHAHASDHLNSGVSTLFRQRVISQVLEAGIVVHSVIIGISVGASKSTNVIKPLVAALTFHQFFEGMGLAGCISQANYRWRAIAVMVVFFSLTTPVGIGIGIGISQFYNENTSTAIIVEGILSSVSAGILIYMALVDLLAQDFMNPIIQSNFRLQLSAYLSLLLGMASMSMLAIWA
ncbi:zinc transporter 1-like [Euphorbia lathyris]|uniref:zinc transporter 1-like n=1 Tax=Euphorbia lathyris TaxID=212925 RepID=UPI0033131737